MAANRELAGVIRSAAAKLGVDPVDLGTAISYETAGTFDPWKRGPTTKWGTHRGLIQWGEPQAAKYGVSATSTLAEQGDAIVRYLQDAGVQPGHGLLDIYSAINAGAVGRYGASDAAAGGAWGTVADKVKYQMAAHRRKALSMLGLSSPQSTGPLKVGSRGDDVAALQANLAKLGFDPGPIDGEFGPKTAGAVRQLQSAMNTKLSEFGLDQIAVDGKWGTKSNAASVALGIVEPRDLSLEARDEAALANAAQIAMPSRVSNAETVRLNAIAKAYQAKPNLFAANIPTAQPITEDRLTRATGDWTAPRTVASSPARMVKDTPVAGVDLRSASDMVRGSGSKAPAGTVTARVRQPIASGTVTARAPQTISRTAFNERFNARPTVSASDKVRESVSAPAGQVTARAPQIAAPRTGGGIGSDFARSPTPAPQSVTAQYKPPAPAAGTKVASLGNAPVSSPAAKTTLTPAQAATAARYQGMANFYAAAVPAAPVTPAAPQMAAPAGTVTPAMPAMTIAKAPAALVGLPASIVPKRVVSPMVEALSSGSP